MIDDYRLKRLRERRKHQRQIMEKLKTMEEELKRLERQNDQLVTTLIDSGT